MWLCLNKEIKIDTHIASTTWEQSSPTKLLTFGSDNFKFENDKTIEVILDYTINGRRETKSFTMKYYINIEYKDYIDNNIRRINFFNIIY